jgi:hypothetical protein
VQYSGAAASWENQAFRLAPSVTHEAAGAVGPAYTGAQVSLAFQGEGSRLCSSGEHGATTSSGYWEAGLTTEPTGGMEPEAMWKFQGWGTRSVEVQVVPILPLVSGFSICRFGKYCASLLLWDPMGVFWGPLIFLFQGS